MSNHTMSDSQFQRRLKDGIAACPELASVLGMPDEVQAPGVGSVAAGSPAGKQAREAALHTHVTGIISGVGDEVYPGRCIRAAKEIVALVRAHDRQENDRHQPLGK